MEVQTRDAYTVVAVGGAVGACARYVCVELQPASTAGFPWSVLLINVLGSALLAWVLVLGEQRFPASSPWHHLWRPFAATGVMGGFTTTSAWAVLSVEFFNSGQALAGLGFAFGSLMAALVAYVLSHELAVGLVRRRKA